MTIALSKMAIKQDNSELWQPQVYSYGLESFSAVLIIPWCTK